MEEPELPGQVPPPQPLNTMPGSGRGGRQPELIVSAIKQNLSRVPPPAAPRRFETRSQKTICSLKCDHKQVGFLQEKREKRENTLVLKMPLSPLKMIPGMFQNNKTAISLQARKQSPQGHYNTSRATGKQGLGKPGEEDIGGRRTSGGGGGVWVDMCTHGGSPTVFGYGPAARLGEGHAPQGRNPISLPAVFPVGAHGWRLSATLTVLLWDHQ